MFYTLKLFIRKAVLSEPSSLIIDAKGAGSFDLVVVIFVQFRINLLDLTCIPPMETAAHVMLNQL